ncbi:MAG: LexA family transcriptional regulator [Desulfobacter sp.]
MDKNFENVLERAKKVLGVETDAQVADAIGMKPSAFNNRKRSGSIPFVHFVELASSQNVDLNWLINGEGPVYKGTDADHQDAGQADKTPRVASPEATYVPVQPMVLTSPENFVRDQNGVRIPQWENPDPEMYHYVPMAETTLNAGGGSFILSEQTTGRYYAFRKNFLSAIASSPKNLVLMKVTGDSMEPKIEDGDTVMIDVGRRDLKSGAIYALGYDDMIVIKETEILPGGKAMIISRNRDMYPPYEVDTNSIRIIGQVIWGDRIFAK